MTATAHDGENNLLEAGDFIAYKLEVSNTGNTCVREVAVSDVLAEVALYCDSDTTGVSLHFSSN